MMASGPRPTVQTTAVQSQSTKHGNIYLIYVHFPGDMKTVSKLELSEVCCWRDLKGRCDILKDF